MSEAKLQVHFLLLVCLLPLTYSVSHSKQLKVPELKDILSKAQVPLGGKANKADLIAKILGSQPALDVYNQLHGKPSGQQEVQKPAEEPTVSLHAAYPLIAAYSLVRR